MSEQEKEQVVLVAPLTDEILAANAELQAEWSKKYSFRAATPESHAQAAAKAYITQYCVLGAQIQETTDINERAQLQGRYVQVARDIIESCRIIGNFYLPQLLAPTEKERQLFVNYELAEMLPDSDWCQHPKWRRTESDFLPNYSAEFEYFSPGSQKRLWMLRCRECGFRNAQELPADLRKLKAVRHSLRDAQTGKTRAEARAAILRDARTAETKTGLNLTDTLKKN